MHEGENKMCKERNKGLRRVNNGTRNQKENKRLSGGREEKTVQHRVNIKCMRWKIKM